MDVPCNSMKDETHLIQVLAAGGCLYIIVVQIFAFSRKIDLDWFVARRIVQVLLAESELPTLAVAEHVQLAGVGDERAMVVPATGRSKYIGKVR